MRVGVSVTGIAHVTQLLRTMAIKLPDTARGQMKRAANRIVKKAKLQTPEDESHLMESIRVEKTYGARGRLQIDIVAGDKTVTKHNGQSVDLDVYAAKVHENYEDMTRENGPGANTLAKMQANPNVKIGSGFLSRAADEEEPLMRERMMSSVNEIIGQDDDSDI